MSHYSSCNDYPFSFKHYLAKRFSIIDTQIARHLVQYCECLSNPPTPFYASQITIPFLNSRISANHDKG